LRTTSSNNTIQVASSAPQSAASKSATSKSAVLQSKSTAPQSKSTAPQSKSIAQSKSTAHQSKSTAAHQSKSAIPKLTSTVPKSTSVVPKSMSTVPKSMSTVPKSTVHHTKVEVHVPQSKVAPQSRAATPFAAVSQPVASKQGSQVTTTAREDNQSSDEEFGVGGMLDEDDSQERELAMSSPLRGNEARVMVSFHLLSEHKLKFFSQFSRPRVIKMRNPVNELLFKPFQQVRITMRSGRDWSFQISFALYWQENSLG
jgi:hypothetical protein